MHLHQRLRSHGSHSRLPDFLDNGRKKTYKPQAKEKTAGQIDESSQRPGLPEKPLVSTFSSQNQPWGDSPSQVSKK